MPTTAERREHDASARSLLAVEEATLGVLADVAQDLGRSPAGAAEELRRRLKNVYVGARRAARQQSRRRTVAELLATRDEAARQGIASAPFVLPELPPADASDESAADLWADGISDILRRRADADGVRRAVTATRRRLELSAQAVTADAWADERERVLGAAAREETAYDFLPAVGRLWDARLDACPACRRLDGTIRPLGVGFPNSAVAGRVHALCRCSSPIFFSLIYLGRRERDVA
jgi:hypothetical protein